jgi:hypothetical protein
MFLIIVIFLRSLWIPEMLIFNIKSYKLLANNKAASTVMVKNNKDGPMEILYMQLAEITFLCPMR